MRILLHSKFFTAIRAFNICGMHVPIITSYNYRKIFYSVVTLVFPRIKWIFCTLMMNKFPSLKISTKVFSHYKAMLENMPILTSHRVKEVIGLKLYSNITLFVKKSSALPIGVCWANATAISSATRTTSGVGRNAPFALSPPFPATIFASSPYGGSARRLLRPNSKIFSYLTKFWHTYIIPYNQKVRKAVYH